MKNNYLNPDQLSLYMPKAKGIWGKNCENLEETLVNYNLCVPRDECKHEYCDIMILCTVMAAFGLLLVVSLLSKTAY
jgi:hypothetical protein